MSASTVGIIYSLSQSKRRALYKFDSDDDLRPVARQGEGYIEQALDDYLKRGPDAAVQDACGGQPPLSDRCAQIDASNTVVDCVLADPVVDAMPDHTLVQSDVALPGDVFILQASKPGGQTGRSIDTAGSVQDMPPSGSFSRTVAITDAHGIVTDIQTVDVTQLPDPPPGGSVVPVGNYQIGDKVRGLILVTE